MSVIKVGYSQCIRVYNLLYFSPVINNRAIYPLHFDSFWLMVNAGQMLLLDLLTSSLINVLFTHICFIDSFVLRQSKSNVGIQVKCCALSTCHTLDASSTLLYCPWHQTSDLCNGRKRETLLSSVQFTTSVWICLCYNSGCWRMGNLKILVQTIK